MTVKAKARTPEGKWVMTISPYRPGQGPKEYHVYIGAVKVAEIAFKPYGGKPPCYLRLMRNFVSYDTDRELPDMSCALRELHVLLKSPPPEVQDGEVG